MRWMVSALTSSLGKFYGLIGPDGAGKSSLLKIVAGVLAQDSGELTVFGTKIRNERDADAVKDRIGSDAAGSWAKFIC
jgi:ABC-2 type transport system ATP-binding protein